MKTHKEGEKRFKDIFIDLDRTLWDFERNSRETFMEIYHKYQLFDHFKSFDLFLITYRKINDALWNEYRSGKISKEELSWKRFYLSLKEVNIDDKEMAENIAQDYITISPTKKKLFPHAHTTLTYLKKQYDLHLITNGFKEVQYQKIMNCGLRRYFKNIFTSEEVGIQKPNKKFFMHVLKKTKAQPEESLVIGDDPEVDIAGAKSVGMSSIWFNPNMNEAEIEPDLEIYNLNDLIHML